MPRRNWEMAEPPQNAEYLLAAYIVTVVILIGYLGLLWRRARKPLRGGK
jgi:preprotein translocase subunit Sss1